MKFQKLILLSLTLFLMLPLVSGSNINGFGSDDFFGYNQQNTAFSVDFTLSYNDTENIGNNENVPIVCDIDKSSIENELLIYSGITLYMYSGVGNKLTLLNSYTSPSTINDIGCIDDKVYVATNNGMISLTYESNSFSPLIISSISGFGTLNASYDIRCNYELGKCVVLNQDGVFISIPDSKTLIFKNITNENFASGDLVSIADDQLVYVADISAKNIYTYNYTNSKGYLYLRDIDSGSIATVPIIFADFGGDGNVDYCYGFGVDGASDSFTSRCYDKTDTNINSKAVASATTVGLVDKIGLNPTKNIPEACYRVRVNAVENYKCYEPYSDVVTSYTGSNIWGKNGHTLNGLDTIFFDTKGNRWSLTEGKIYNGTTEIFDSGISSAYHIVADITGDTKGEIIISSANELLVLFDSSVDTGVLPATITYPSNAINGGYFGYYDGDICTGTTITYEALECIGDLQNCNYFNENPTENERLHTDCGLGGATVYGSFDSNNPTVECTYNTEGSYNVVIYIQDSAELNSTNNENVPISINVADTPNCNNINDILNQPNLVQNSTTEDGGSGSAPDQEDEIDGGVTEPSKGGEVANALLNNILMIIGFSIIIGVIAWLYFSGIKNALVLTMTGFLMLTIVTALQLVPFVISLYVGTGFLIIGLVVGFILKNVGGN